MDSWDGTFENTPNNLSLLANEPVDVTTTRVRTRERSGAEHKFGLPAVNTGTDLSTIYGATTIGGPSDDSGRHWLGSARTFYQNAAPTGLFNADQLGSTALDDARLWVDTSQNGDATPHSRLRIRCYDKTTTAWLEGGANCGQIPNQVLVNGVDAGLLANGVWTDALAGGVHGATPSTITVNTPTTFNGAQYTLLVEGFMSFSTSNGPFNVLMGITTGAVGAANVAEATVPMALAVFGTSGFVKYQSSTALGTLAANTTYTFRLQVNPSAAGLTRGATSGASTFNGQCWLRAYLLNAGAA